MSIHCATGPKEEGPPQKKDITKMRAKVRNKKKVNSQTEEIVFYIIVFYFIMNRIDIVYVLFEDILLYEVNVKI